jgi:hypothetical protein
LVTGIKLGFSSEMLAHCIKNTVEELACIVEFASFKLDQFENSGIKMDIIK